MATKLKITGFVGISLLLLYLFCFSGGNFYYMRKVAFSKFHTFLAESDVSPTIFKGPTLDLSSEKNLIFKWFYYDKDTDDSLTVIVFVPPWFSSFHATVGGTGGKPETWKKLAGTWKKNSNK